MKIAAVVMAGMLLSAPMTMPMMAQTATQTATADVSDNQLVMMTVHEAWVASGRNEDKFFDFVKRLAEMSASKRAVTLPETEAAGTKAGDLIKASARRDPDQLLYAVVDHAVKMTTTTVVTKKTK